MDVSPGMTDVIATPAARRRRLRFSIRALLALTFVVGSLIVIVFPEVCTGKFGRFTIAEISVDGSGRIRLVGDAVISGKNSVAIAGIEMGCTLSSEGTTVRRWLPTWPREQRLVILCSVDSGEAVAAVAAVKGAIRVSEGETYTARPGEPIELVRWTTPTGVQSMLQLMITPPAPK
jgi:hypothetical protein